MKEKRITFKIFQSVGVILQWLTYLLIETKIIGYIFWSEWKYTSSTVLPSSDNIICVYLWQYVQFFEIIEW